jgi:hypothetical protein
VRAGIAVPEQSLHIFGSVEARLEELCIHASNEILTVGGVEVLSFLHSRIHS